jgi:A/G-specific adenine glycosylase
LKIDFSFIMNNKIEELNDFQIQQFQKVVYDNVPVLRKFPWRWEEDPYAVLVSEVMLQQTQTQRVLPKYISFLRQFPTFSALSEATLNEVLAAWSGLGYNRRAKSLHQIAKIVLEKYRGILPRDSKQLLALPGLGKYTVAALRVFAFGEREILIETNIRTVYSFHFFPDALTIADNTILPFIDQTVDEKSVRDWFYALMDYGVLLKQQCPTIGQKSSHYKKQSSFSGSDREARGRVIKLLTTTERSEFSQLVNYVNRDESTVKKVLAALQLEGFVCEEADGAYTINPNSG